VVPGSDTETVLMVPAVMTRRMQPLGPNWALAIVSLAVAVMTAGVVPAAPPVMDWDDRAAMAAYLLDGKGTAALAGTQVLALSL
jgi:hypothetical protein